MALVLHLLREPFSNVKHNVSTRHNQASGLSDVIYLPTQHQLKPSVKLVI